MNEEYQITHDAFFNWVFKNIEERAKLNIFLTEQLLNLRRGEVKFTLEDVLKSFDTVPSYLIEEYTGPNINISTKNIELI